MHTLEASRPRVAGGHIGVPNRVANGHRRRGSAERGEADRETRPGPVRHSFSSGHQRLPASAPSLRECLRPTSGVRPRAKPPMKRRRDSAAFLAPRRRATGRGERRRRGRCGARAAGTRPSPTASAASSSRTPSRREAPASCASRRSVASPTERRSVLVFARDGYRTEQRVAPCRDALMRRCCPHRPQGAAGPRLALLEDAARLDGGGRSDRAGRGAAGDLAGAASVRTYPHGRICRRTAARLCSRPTTARRSALHESSPRRAAPGDPSGACSTAASPSRWQRESPLLQRPLPDGGLRAAQARRCGKGEATSDDDRLAGDDARRSRSPENRWPRQDCPRGARLPTTARLPSLSTAAASLRHALRGDPHPVAIGAAAPDERAGIIAPGVAAPSAAARGRRARLVVTRPGVPCSGPEAAWVPVDDLLARLAPTRGERSPLVGRRASRSASRHSSTTSASACSMRRPAHRSRSPLAAPPTAQLLAPLLPASIIETGVGLEFGWRHAAGCRCAARAGAHAQPSALGAKRPFACFPEKSAYSKGTTTNFTRASSQARGPVRPTLRPSGATAIRRSRPEASNGQHTHHHRRPQRALRTRGHGAARTSTATRWSASPRRAKRRSRSLPLTRTASCSSTRRSTGRARRRSSAACSRPVPATRRSS